MVKLLWNRSRSRKSYAIEIPLAERVVFLIDIVPTCSVIVEIECDTLVFLVFVKLQQFEIQNTVVA